MAGYDHDAFGSPGHEGAEEGMHYQYCLKVCGSSSSILMEELELSPAPWLYITILQKLP